ncbi:hypothetical protein F4827_006086 [Paraburkholderia bannensis]|uniref:DUF6708 domain-containing protein n=1 Tax=Paraburkholderia bannensis TaxID=765414 RepID=A0A7W9WUB1_9BURK|nr:MULTISPECIES: DUF6708 domain-containing protein [Paraburkholderia]MBB3261178.1 hypothetical protein [Paraburkholderia sp. WP4_3_2]MBB6106215.1 hypothetical protein [Paraburkholderia bannensis]
MYNGWMRPFAVNRILLPEERKEALRREAQAEVEPGQHMGLIRLNSTYIDWIDRRFRFRGMLNTSIATLGGLFVVGLGLFVFGDSILFDWTYSDWLLRVCLSFGVCLFAFGSSYVLYYTALRYDYHTYTHYPIRFNRKTRMVHVFRHNGPDGVLSVPWESVYFHLGHGSGMPFLRDIRGEVMEGDTVKDTFALGHAMESETPVREMWEFIRRYMDQGPEAVADSPMAKYIALSVTPTLKNCMLFAVSFTNATTPFKRALLSPFIVLFTLTRWVVFRTSQEPVFPAEVEMTCEVALNDPNVWPVPESTGQFAAEIPGVMKYAEAKARRSWERERQKELESARTSKSVEEMARELERKATRRTLGKRSSRR